MLQRGEQPPKNTYQRTPNDISNDSENSIQRFGTTVTDDTDSQRPTREERVTATREVVYDEAGKLITANELDAALEAIGVTVTESDDGLPEYRDVPRAVSLSACHLAVDLRRDPAAFIREAEPEDADSGVVADGGG